VFASRRTSYIGTSTWPTQPQPAEDPETGTQSHTHTLAPSYRPTSGTGLYQQIHPDHGSYESINPPPTNQSTRPWAAFTKKIQFQRLQPRNSKQSEELHHQSPNQRPKKKFTKFQWSPKRAIRIFRKKSTFQVSYPREPLESYEITKNTAGPSTNTKKDSTSSTTKESTASEASPRPPCTSRISCGDQKPPSPSTESQSATVGYAAESVTEIPTEST
jgi:hypothetical protein